MDYGILLIAWILSLFFARFGLHYSLGFLYVASQVTDWQQFAALAVLLVVGALWRELAKSVGLDMVDANLIGVSVPHSLLRPGDAVMQRTIARIERDLHVPASGLHRHLDDVYYGGGVWVLLALWLAWYYIEAGDRTRARGLVTWAECQADAKGNLPEQVNSAMLAPGFYGEWVKRRGPIAQPLLWSHAEYLIVCQAWAGV